MSVAAIAAATVAVATVATTATTLAKGGPKASQTSSVEFPEETRRLFQDIEAPILEGAQDEQSSLLAPFLGGFKNDNFAASQFGGAKPVVEAATRKGAEVAGIDDLGPAFENINGLTPELLKALSQLTLQRGAQVNTVVPPGYGQFLSPNTFVQSSSDGPSPFETGFQVAGSLAGAVGAFV